MNHTPTPYMIESDTDPITIIRQERGCWYGEVIAHCGSAKIPANHRHAAFIVRACNAHEALVEALSEMVQVYLRPSGPSTGNIVNDKRREACEQAVMTALKLARGE